MADGAPHRGPDGGSWFVAGLGIAVGAVLLIGARSISPPIFDPVGSAALPRACAVALIGLGLGALLQSAIRGRRGAAAPVGDAPVPIRPATAATVVAMAACLASMELGLGFGLASTAFIAATIPLVAGSARVLPVALGVAILVGFGSVWLFTSVFFVDLPGT